MCVENPTAPPPPRRCASTLAARTRLSRHQDQADVLSTAPGRRCVLAAGKKVAQCAVAGGQALVPPGAGVVSGLTGGVGFSARADVAQASVEGAEPGQPPFFPGVAGRSPWETAPRAEKAPGSVNGRRSLSHGAQRRSSA